MNAPTEKDTFDYDTIGTDEQFVSVAPDMENAIDEALGLQPISIRLQKNLLDNLKALAQLNGIGYQPLVRQILTRWVDSELKNILRERLAQEKAQGSLSAEPADPDRRDEQFKFAA